MRRSILPGSARAPFALFALAAALAACGEAGTEVDYTDPEPGTEAPAAERTDCVEADFAGAPLAGPGFADGVYTGPTDAPLVASSTVLYLLDRPDAGPRFEALMGEVSAELMRSEGLLGVALGGSQLCGAYRTLALWRDTEAMMGFVSSDAHLQAMVAARELADRGTRTVHWGLDPASETLDWALGRSMASGAAAIEGLGER